MRAADALARTLDAQGTDVVFALSGNQIMPIFDALLDTPIRVVHTRHEAAAGYMAEAHAQISGKVGVALVTAGAGLGNAISPLLTARASQTPLLLLSGDSPAASDGTGAFQEMDQVAVTASITKLSRRITDAGTLEDELLTALDTARSGQPGPVQLSLPADVLMADVAGLNGRVKQTAPGDPDVSDIVEALAFSRKPLILLGPELSPTRARLDFSELGIPAIPMESPRGAKDPALGRFAEAWQDADLVIALGKPIDFTVHFGDRHAWPKARWLTVHGDPAEVTRARSNLGERLTAGHDAAPREVAKALIERSADIPGRPEWLAEVLGLCALRPDTKSGDAGIDSAQVSAAIAAFVARAEQPIFISDGGEIGQWAQAFVSAPRRIVNGVSGAIGGGICYALGAKAASPEASVIAVMGDGTAGFHLAEFETAIREDLPFVAIIGNDRRWNAEHELQRRTFGPDRLYACQLSGARYDQAASALGGFGAHVTSVSDLADAFAEALNSGRPACVNVEIAGLPAPAFS